MSIWNPITEAMAQHDPHLRAALEKRVKRVESAPVDDRLHRIEVSLQDVIRYEEEENEHVLNLYRTVQRQVIDLKHMIAEMEHEIGCLSAQVAGLSYERSA